MRNIFTAGKAVLFFSAMVLLQPSRAEDIDIFGAALGASDLPNVLFILDNSANWGASIPVPNCYYKENGVTSAVGPPSGEQGKKMSIEKCALYNMIDGLDTNADGSAKVRFGLMLFNAGSLDGAYPRLAVTPVTTSNKGALKAMISSLSISTDKANNAPFTKSMYEAYLYFKGATPFNGTTGTTWDRAAVVGGKYLSPSVNDCARNYIVFLANGGPGENNGDGLAVLTSVGGNTTPISYASYPSNPVTNSDAANWADEFARFLKGSDVSTRDGVQNIITYGVAMTGASSDGLYPNFIRGMSELNGGGKYFPANNLQSLETAFADIFNQVNALNGAFVSANLPASTNSQGTFLNQVFMGLFRPDASSNPRWQGNLKQYKFKYDIATDQLSLADSNNNAAINNTGGFFAPSAVSYWTTASSYWVNQKLGTPPSISDSPDGEVVEKGGVSQRLRTSYATGQTARKMYTCVGCSANTDLTASASAFAVTNTAITSTQLGVATSTDRADLINWVRGADNVVGAESGPGGGVTIRPSTHGDVLHSRPLALNYGGSTGIVVFYGANDGTFRAVSGSQSTGGGEELWSFVPEEFFGKLKRLHDNTPGVRLSTTSLASSAIPKDYFADGSIGLYQKVVAGVTQKAYIYLSMRRGGRFIYAIDVTVPTSPKLLWKKKSTDGGFSNLGQTWSEPKVAKIKGNANPVLVFGAGYDAAAEDVSPAGNTTMGNAVFVLDAFDGSLIKKFATDRSVPADVAVIDSDADGFVDRAYAVDVGGNLYRVDFESASQSSSNVWGIYKVAALAGSGTRKFFFPPDVVLTRSFVALLVGSGDREKPLQTTGTDAFFTVYDTKVSKGTPASVPAAITASSLGRVGAGENTTQGCYIPMISGEKVVTSATTIAGVTYFSTNRPTPSTGIVCAANLGEAKAYASPLFCQTPTTDILQGGGLPPSPISGLVTVTYTSDATGAQVSELMPFLIGGINPKSSAIEAVKPKITLPPKRVRRYWYLDEAR